MQFRTIAYACAIVAPATLAPASHAATLASYNFDGASTASTDTDASTTASDYDPRSAFMANTGRSGISSSSENAFMRSEEAPFSSNIGTNTNTYHSFTLTVDGLAPNEVLNITSLSYSYGPNTGASNSAGQLISALYASPVGFVDADDRIARTALSGSENNSGAFVIIDLTSTNTVAGESFTGLTNGEVVEFRFLFGDNFTGGAIHRVDNIILSGEVEQPAIPEPASLALFGLGGLTMLSRRRK